MFPTTQRYVSNYGRCAEGTCCIIQAHALTVRMVEEVQFPFMVLLASGGHCILAGTYLARLVSRQQNW